MDKQTYKVISLGLDKEQIEEYKRFLERLKLKKEEEIKQIDKYYEMQREKIEREYNMKLNELKNKLNEVLQEIYSRIEQRIKTQKTSDIDLAILHIPITLNQELENKRRELLNKLAVTTFVTPSKQQIILASALVLGLVFIKLLRRKED